MIRCMEERDIQQIARLEELCFSESWSARILESGLFSPYDVYYVYEQDGRIVGYCNLRVLAGEGEIQRIAVHPDSRRLGIGRILMDAMLSYASDKKVYAVSLEVRESNLPARNLYESYGFAKEAVRKAYYHNPTEDAVMMWKRDFIEST